MSSCLYYSVNNWTCYFLVWYCSLKPSLSFRLIFVQGTYTRLSICSAEMPSDWKAFAFLFWAFQKMWTSVLPSKICSFDDDLNNIIHFLSFHALISWCMRQWYFIACQQLQCPLLYKDHYYRIKIIILVHKEYSSSGSRTQLL